MWFSEVGSVKDEHLNLAEHVTSEELRYFHQTRCTAEKEPAKTLRSNLYTVRQIQDFLNRGSRVDEIIQ